MALAIDGSTPALVAAGGSVLSSLTTASFTPPVGALLAVMYVNGDNTLQLQNAPTNTGGTVSWGGAAATSLSTQGSGASIWLGTVTSSAAMTVTAHVTSANSNWAFAVAVITGQAASPAGAVQATSSASGLPSDTITSLTGANSLVLGCVADNTNSATTPAPGANQTITFNALAFNDTTAGRAGWCQYDTRISLAAGASDTLNVTTPTIQFAMVMLEILAVAGAVASIPDLIMAPAHR